MSAAVLEVLDIVPRMEAAALAAAGALYKAHVSGSVPEKSYKADGSIVLPIDTACQKIILEKLGDEFPIVAEEAPESHRLLSSAKSFFVVDPLDGTSACRRFLMSAAAGQVGFGPIVGLVWNKKLVAATYYDFPGRSLYTAVCNAGAYAVKHDLVNGSGIPNLQSRTRLMISGEGKLSDAAVLFYTGARGEMKLVEALRRKELIETAYRFGGFANDCSRLANGLEQIIVQFSVKIWDFAAVLFPAESGHQVIVEPFGEKLTLGEWLPRMENPLVLAPTHLSDEFVQIIENIKREGGW